MKEGAKKALYRNAGIIFFAVVIIAVVIISEITESWSESWPTLVIMLMALFTLGECFRQAIQVKR